MACALGLAVAAGRPLAAWLCLPRRAAAARQGQGSMTTFLIRRFLTSPPKFLPRAAAPFPFCLPRPPTRAACAPRIESTRRPGKKKSATMHDDTYPTFPSGKEHYHSQFPLSSLLSATILSAPSQPNVLCLPPSPLSPPLSLSLMSL
jgi:hypothetical protein